MSKRGKIFGMRKWVAGFVIVGLLFGVGLGLYLNDTTREVIAGLTTDQIMFNVWNQTDNTLKITVDDIEITSQTNDLAVDPDAAKTFFTKYASATSNAITIDIAAVAEKKHYVQYIFLYDTAGTGASEDFYVKDDTTKVYDSDFTIDTDKELACPGDSAIVSAAVNKAMEIKASATNLTGGSLLVLGYTK